MYVTWQESWVIPGAMDARYRLDTAHLVPYTQASADRLSGQLRGSSCAAAFTAAATAPLKPFHKHPLISNVWDPRPEPEAARDAEGGSAETRDFDCSLPLNYTLNELQLVRLETRVHHRGLSTNQIAVAAAAAAAEAAGGVANAGNAGRGARSRVVRELLLGDVHTELAHRQRHRPTSFQEPLRDVQVWDVCWCWWWWWWCWWWSGWCWWWW